MDGWMDEWMARPRFCISDQRRENWWRVCEVGGEYYEVGGKYYKVQKNQKNIAQSIPMWSPTIVPTDSAINCLTSQIGRDAVGLVVQSYCSQKIVVGHTCKRKSGRGPSATGDEADVGGVLRGAFFWFLIVRVLPVASPDLK